MRIISFTEKNSEKNWNLIDFRSDPNPQFPEVDPDPRQNEADLEH